jgi:hypothetical protein
MIMNSDLGRMCSSAYDSTIMTSIYGDCEKLQKYLSSIAILLAVIKTEKFVKNDLDLYMLYSTTRLINKRRVR